jgi:hypothetical protein
LSRGPPKWFGQKNPRWMDPNTVEEEKAAYMKMVEEIKRKGNS